jgi:hypothetical protein
MSDKKDRFGGLFCGLAAWCGAKMDLNHHIV